MFGPKINRHQAYGLGGAVLTIILATILHNPFGGYVSDDGLYTKIQFLRQFREAFPEYADLSDADLLSKVFAKYPGFKTWIREETDGSAPLPVAVPEQVANYRLQPPPAYYGTRPRKYSPYALVSWIDEPIEYFGILLPAVFGGAVWFWFFRERHN
jgi:hypothetical protein